MAGVSVGSGDDRSRLRLLLASSSVAALLIGGGAPAYAVVPCSPFLFNGVSNTGVNNSGAIACIDIQNSTIAGGVINAGTGVITANGGGTPSKTGITINNSTVTGTVANSGTITAAGNGIFITSNATVSGGVSNGGTIAAGVNGVFVGGTANPGASIAVSTFAGGIGNSGAISAASGNGIFIGGNAGANGGGNGLVSIAAFSGGISNTSTISAASNGIQIGGTARAGSSATATVVISSFSGGITNFGTISATNGFAQGGGIFVGGAAEAGSGGHAFVTISTFSGGISNGGTISSPHQNGIFVGGTAQGGPSGTSSVLISSFSGGITNSGNIAAGGTDNGIVVGGRAVDFSGSVSVLNFSGGISNSGAISAGHGIVVGGLASGSGVSVAVSNFTGGVTNSGNITARTGQGILVGGQARGPSSGTFVSIAAFGGGISNSGTISARQNGIVVGGTASGGSVTISNFSGGVANSGTISARSGAGIFVGGFASGGSVTISTFSGGISNSGMISARQAGIFVGGSTNFGGSVTISTFSGGVTNSGAISVTGLFGAGIIIEDVVTFLGNVWNSGTITAPRGTGIFVCDCATFAGGAIVNTGTISALEGIVVHNFSAVSIFDSGTITGSVAAIDLTQASGGNTLTLGPGFSFPNNSPVLGFGNDTFQLGGSGNGSFDLSTIGTQITGFTTFNVVSGTWTVSNTFGQTQGWTVMGGTLAGTGTLTAINVLGPGGTNPDGGGTLEPGIVGQPGTFMTVTGNLTFAPGAAYLVNISPATASRANVGGAAFLNGVVEGVLTPGSYSSAKTYDILSTASISGTFAGFTAINAPGFRGTLAVVGDPEVTLKLTAQLGSGGGLNPNQQGVATGINNDFNSGGTLPASFFPLFTLAGGNLANALTRLDGEVATGAQTSAFQSMNEFLNLLLDPASMSGGNGEGGGPLGFAPQQASLPPEVALAYASILKAPPLPSTDHRWTSWGAAYGGSSLTDGNAAIGSNNVTASDYGFAGGMEYHVDPSTLYGFALAGGGTNWNLANALGSGRSDTFQAGIYGKRYFGPAYVSGALAFANNWFTTNRTAFAGDQLTASFDGQSYAARLEGGYRYALPAPGSGAIVGVTPYAALQTQWFHTPSYGETDLTGGGFGLTYNAMTGNDTRSELGARFDNLTMLYGMPLILRGRLAWAHDWVSNPSLDAAFQILPGTNFIVYGAAPPQDSALTTAGAELHINANWSLLGKFDGDFAPGAQTYAGSGTLRYTW
jgi:uncharacterized protein with beta-barrel porin domain